MHRSDKFKKSQPTAKQSLKELLLLPQDRCEQLVIPKRGNARRRKIPDLG